jgi:hypothetical protein
MLTCALWVDPSFAQEPGPSWGLRLRSTGYRFESVAPFETALDRFGFYHAFDVSAARLAEGRIDFRASGRFADDGFLADDVTDRSRLHTATLVARVGSGTTVRVGRQFLLAGPFGFTLDGGAVSIQPTRAIELLAWGGARAPGDFGFDTRDFGDERRLGARLQWRSMSTRIAGSFSAIDETRRGEASLVGFDGSTRLFRRFVVSARASYDAELEAWDREEVRVRWHQGRGWPVVTLQGIDRAQATTASLFFRQFESAERIRLGRVVVRHEPVPGFGAEVEALGTDVDDYSSGHVGWAVLFPYGRVGYLRRTGDGGQSDAWTGDLGFPVFSWLRFEGGVSAETYALLDEIEDESDERDLVSAFARLQASVTEGISLICEGQDRTTPELSEDWRLLVGVEVTTGLGSPAIPRFAPRRLWP